MMLGGEPWWRATRRRLCSQIWGASTIPSTVATRTHANYNGSIEATYASSVPAECDHVDRLVASRPRTAAGSIAHLIYPSAEPNGRCAIVHGGHSITYYDESTRLLQMVSAHLTAGTAVLGMCMPTDGVHTSPLVLDLEAGGTTSISNHDFSAIEADGVHSWRYFVEPVIQMLNYLDSIEAPFSFVDMTGISGGGWTTDMASAVDRRIRRSAPVFGSVPLGMRPPGNAGDWEQRPERQWWDVLSPRDYEAAYALGCVDLGRSRLHVVGDEDPVFPVVSVHAELDAMAERIDARIRGTHSVRIDSTTNEHECSDETIAAVASFFAA